LYITIGSLLMVWTGVWYVYVLNHPPETSQVHYWLAGLALTGLTLAFIGLAVGQIGRSARPAEPSNPAVIAAPTEQAAVPAGPVAPPATQNAPAVPAPGNGNGAVAAQPVPTSAANASVRQPT
jgi:hypothetical protein